MQEYGGIAKAGASLIDTLMNGMYYVFFGLLFTFFRNTLVGHYRTPRQAFFTYLLGGTMAYVVGMSMLHLDFNLGAVLSAVSFTSFISENLLLAILNLAASLSKDPEKFVERWLGKHIKGDQKDGL